MKNCVINFNYSVESALTVLSSDITILGVKCVFFIEDVSDDIIDTGLISVNHTFGFLSHNSPLSSAY